MERCQTCGKGIQRDADGRWRTALGNLGTGHDHAPAVPLGALMDAVARNSEATYAAANEGAK